MWLGLGLGLGLACGATRRVAKGAADGDEDGAERQDGPRLAEDAPCHVAAHTVEEQAPVVPTRCAQAGDRAL